MPDGNSPPPPISPRWQKQLTSLLGLNPYGKPKLRLVWGQTTTHFFMERERIKYIRSRQPIFTGYQEKAKNEETGEWEVINRYPPTLAYPDVPKGHFLESLGRMETIGVDRWFIELWRGVRIASGGHTQKSWDKEYRYKHLYDPQKGIYRQVDFYGEFPFDGDYNKAEYAYPWMISRHCTRKTCCEEREAAGLICLGEYRAPEQRDIDFIAYLIAEKDKEKYVSGYDEVAPVSAIAQPLRDALREEAEAQEKKDLEIAYRVEQIRKRNSLKPVHYDIRRNN